MELNFKIDTNNPEDITDAIAVLETVHGALYDTETPDHEDSEQRAGVEKVETYADDFTEAPDAEQFTPQEIAVDPLDTMAPELQQPAPPPPGVELDSEGLPWDARIHTTAKTKLKKDNTWKLKRGVEKTLVDQVKAELRAVMAVPSAPVHAASAMPSHELPTQKAPQVATDAQAMPATEQAPVTPNAAAIFAQQPAANIVPMPNIVPPGMPTQPAAIPEPPKEEAVDFASFIQTVTQRITANPAFNEEIAKVLAKHGIPSMPLLGTRTDLIPKINSELDTIWNNMQS